MTDATLSDDTFATAEEVQRARELHCDDSDNTREIDEPAKASHGDGGRWVQGWFYVSDSDMPGDIDLTAEQLDAKYNPNGDGEHPKHTRGEWVGEVFALSTLRGYWDWVVSEIEQDGE